MVGARVVVVFTEISSSDPWYKSSELGVWILNNNKETAVRITKNTNENIYKKWKIISKSYKS